MTSGDCSEDYLRKHRAQLMKESQQMHNTYVPVASREKAISEKCKTAADTV
jgi:hypothetical protein